MGWQDDSVVSKPAWQNDSVVSGMPKSQEINTNPTAGMTGSEKFIAGVGGGMTNVARGLGQLLGIVSPQDVLAARKLDEPLMQTGAGQAGDIVGNLALTMAPGLAAGKAAMVAARALRIPAAVAPAVAAGGAGALISGATSTVAPDETRLGAAALGAAGGVGGDLAARLVSRVAQPLAQSDAVKALLKNGVVPTVGQSAGASSFLGKIEQKLQSLPVIGDLISGSRNRAVNEFNQAAIGRALPSGASQPNAIGRSGIEYADRILSDGYDDVLNRIGTVKIPPTFASDVANISKDPDIALSPAMRRRLDEIVGQQIMNRNPASSDMTAQVAKRADANLGRLARDYAGSQDGDQRMLGNAIREVQSAWRANIRANAPSPEIAAELDGLNKAFANFVRVERAAGSVGAKDGVFSAAQLNNAVKALDTSSRHGNFAQGRALMQDLTDPAMSTLHATVPNSGSIDRALIAAGIGGTAAGANEYFGGPGYLTALALSPLAFSRAGSRYAIGDLMPGQQYLSSTLRGAAPYASQVGRSWAAEK
jgi:hypothetical protein